jgi:hypothetical protein
MRNQYLGDGAVVAVARLGDEVIGHGIAVVRKDDKEFKGSIRLEDMPS